MTCSTTKGKQMSHAGSCFCGAVKLAVRGAPEGMGYCHCSSCRSWSGGPINAFSLWKPEAVEIESGTEHIATFQKTPLSERKYCRKCGGHLIRWSSSRAYTSTTPKRCCACGTVSRSSRIFPPSWAAPGKPSRNDRPVSGKVARAGRPFGGAARVSLPPTLFELRRTRRSTRATFRH